MIESAVVRKGARIVSAAGEGTEGDEPSHVLMRHLIDAFAEYERLIIVARTKAALQAKKARGERVGYIPFGCRLGADGKHLEPDPKEQAIRATIVQLHRQGLSLRQIARELNAPGTFNRGNRWHHVAVLRTLRNAA
jgi:DNA invertase Pin-like site-specific DNA recombinase